MSFCDISIVYPWQDGRTNNPSLPVVYIPHDHHHPSNTWHILASLKIIASYSIPAPLPSPAISHLIAGNHFRLSLSVRTSNIISTSLHEIQLSSWISSQKLPQKRSKNENFE